MSESKFQVETGGAEQSSQLCVPAERTRGLDRLRISLSGVTPLRAKAP